jgi:hypothetical protein
VNYNVHSDLSLFRLLLGDNSPMSSGLILKMNMCYKGVSRELKKFTWWRGKWISCPLPEEYNAFYRPYSGRITMD